MVDSGARAAARLLSRGMLAVLMAQFLSALADNAVLFVAIGLLRAQHYADWYTPLLQECFVVSYVLLAPFVGPFADAFPKGRVMLIANACKFFGTGAMLAGGDPLLAYGIIGLGAATYSPAKYGILSELVDAARLVKANALLESSTIVAILAGVVLGGWLADWSIRGALVVVAGIYVLAGLANLLIPRLPAAHPLARYSLLHQLKDFRLSVKTFLRHPDGLFTILGTSIFWGAGATLRFLLVAFVGMVLAIHNNHTAANLNGAVAAGIIVGAAIAGRYINLGTVRRALPFGLAIGLLVMLLAHLHSLDGTVAVLVLIGLCGGAYVVPLNALIQDIGQTLAGVGHALAIQNLFENAMMVLMVGIYTLLMKGGVPVVTSATGIGLLVFASILTLSWMRRRR